MDEQAPVEPREKPVIMTTTKINIFISVFILFIVSALGVAGGYFLSSVQSSIPGAPATSPEDKKTAIGLPDKKRFPDKAEGLLREGGIEGEGNFHLERKGGESQNVYLTSSIVDLSPLVGKKVRVWGETFQGQKAGWLMDVGYVESL